MICVIPVFDRVICVSLQLKSFNEEDGILGRALINIRDDHWKHVRAALTPTFSAQKLKMVQRQVRACADQLVEHIAKKQEEGENFEAKA